MGMAFVPETLGDPDPALTIDAACGGPPAPAQLQTRPSRHFSDRRRRRRPAPD